MFMLKAVDDQKEQSIYKNGASCDNELYVRVLYRKWKLVKVIYHLKPLSGHLFMYFGDICFEPRLR